MKKYHFTYQDGENLLKAKGKYIGKGKTKQENPFYNPFINHKTIIKSLTKILTSGGADPVLNEATAGFQSARIISADPETGKETLTPNILKINLFNNDREDIVEGTYGYFNLGGFTNKFYPNIVLNIPFKGYGVKIIKEGGVKIIPGDYSGIWRLAGEWVFTENRFNWNTEDIVAVMLSGGNPIPTNN